MATACEGPGHFDAKSCNIDQVKIPSPQTLTGTQIRSSPSLQLRLESSDTWGVIRVCLIVSLLVTSIAQGAYRVYKLKITHYDEEGKARSVQYVLTSLDPRQYEGYYGAFRWDKVEMLDTWYCPGDTSYRRYCPKPKVYDLRSPASDPGNRYYIPYNRQPVIP